MSWEATQASEKDWWGDCRCAYQEEVKQETYAKFMGLKTTFFMGRMAYDAENKSVIDIGGGPASILVKTINLKAGTVVDPIIFPEWVEERYRFLNITRICKPAEELPFAVKHVFDEAWVYNCLQHVQSPEMVLTIAQHVAKVVRIFEWIDSPVDGAHLWVLTRSMLDKALGCTGQAMYLTHDKYPGCSGMAYYAIVGPKGI